MFTVVNHIRLNLYVIQQVPLYDQNEFKSRKASRDITNNTTLIYYNEYFSKLSLDRHSTELSIDFYTGRCPVRMLCMVAQKSTNSSHCSTNASNNHALSLVANNPPAIDP